MLGVPYGDHDFFQQKSALMSSSQSTAQEASAAADALCDGYIVDLVRRKDLVPTDDLLSRLVVKYLRTGEATEHDLVAWARLILVAGHITSANTMALGLLALMENLEQFAALIAEPALLPNAVEEILRYVDVAHNGRRRTALDDIELAGVTIAAGDSIILHNSTANRDGRIFEDPDSFNIRREHAQHHVAFGYGVHQCLGQHLARAEIRSVLELVVSRIPGVKLAPEFDTKSRFPQFLTPRP
jgi:cytochrome P450